MMNRESRSLIVKLTLLTAILFLGTGCGGAGGKSTSSGADDAAKMPPAPKPAAKGAFETGVYRNMFAEFGLDEKDIQKKLEDSYQQFFHGNPDTEAVMYKVDPNENGPMAYIKDIGSNDIRSEGMSYGMMISLQMDKQDDFNAIWNWAYTYMYHKDKSNPDYGYFAWQMRDDGTRMDDNPAPDGEEYFAMSLYFAANRWGNGDGIYNYKKAADQILTDMVHREDMTGPINGGETATITSLMNTETYMIRFTPNRANFESNSDHTDPSYHLPAFYELFAMWGPEADREFWKKAAQVSRDYFHTVTHPETGLAPDYASFDGKPVAASWDANTVDFRYDAFRTAMNWTMDCAWFAKDLERQEALTNRLQAFFAQEGVYSHVAKHTIAGEPVDENRSIGLSAMNATAGLCASHERAWEFIELVWNTPMITGKWRYYDGMLYMFGLLHLSGNYKIYKPSK